MKVSHLIGMALLAALSSTTFAFSGSKFMTKNLSAGETFTLPLTSLYSGVNYSLDCTFSGGGMERDNTALEIVSDKVLSAEVTRNGYTYNTKTDHIVTDFKEADAKIVMEPVSNASVITVRNLDFKDLMVVYCYANVTRT